MSDANKALTYLSVFLLSAGALLFEIGLTRLFSVAQFYHFAFMLVSLALLGFGVGGTLLASAPGLVRWTARPERLRWLAAAFALTTPGAYAIINYVPFDSFRIAWDARQVGLLALDFAALAVPFSLVGLAVGALLAAEPRRSHRLYAANLAGSAAGAALAVILPNWLGGESVVTGAALLGALAALLVMLPRWGRAGGLRSVIGNWQLVVAALIGVILAWMLVRPPDWMMLRLSPFKPLSQASTAPDAVVSLSRWDAAARVDVLQSATVRMLPGISFAFQGAPPQQVGLYVDGDSPSPISHVDLSDPSSFDFSGHLSESVAFELRPAAEVLIVEPGGGLDVVAALAHGAQHVTVTYREPLIPEIILGPYAAFSSGLLADPRVAVVREDSRAFLQRPGQRFDVILLSLTDPNRSITSGAYSLSESYSLTVKAALASLQRLAPGGVFVISRWLQSPPSEELRTYGLLLAALHQLGAPAPAERQVIGLRGFQHATFIAKPDGFDTGEWNAVRAFSAARRFDLIAGPGLDVRDVNRYSVLPEPVYYEALTALRTAPDRDAFYAAYEFDVSPPTDDRPYFFHFFKWRQTPQVLARLGQAWLPFGGSGYFVLVLLLALACALGAGLIAIPVLLRHGRGRSSGLQRDIHHGEGGRAQGVDGRALALGSVPRPGGWGLTSTLLYFAALGFGFLLAEIPLAQRYILFLGRPVYALAAVIGAVLLFSGLGSLTALRWNLRWALALLLAVILAYPSLLTALFSKTLSLALGARVIVALVSLAPLGLLLGVPFSAGLAQLGIERENRIPWAWAINGSASVVSATLAPLLSLSFGFTFVLHAGAVAYLGALCVALVNGTKRTSRMR